MKLKSVNITYDIRQKTIPDIFYKYGRPHICHYFDRPNEGLSYIQQITDLIEDPISKKKIEVKRFIISCVSLLSPYVLGFEDKEYLMNPSLVELNYDKRLLTYKVEIPILNKHIEMVESLKFTFNSLDVLKSIVNNDLQRKLILNELIELNRKLVNEI